MLFSILSPELPAKFAVPAACHAWLAAPRHRHRPGRLPSVLGHHESTNSHSSIDTIIIIRYDMNEYRKLFIHIINMKEVTSVGQKTSIKNSRL